MPKRKPDEWCTVFARIRVELKHDIESALGNGETKNSFITTAIKTELNRRNARSLFDYPECVTTLHAKALSEK